jgi:flagellar export protein FliJ
MKKFRFPLRSVATVRNLAEIRAREAFSAAVQVYVEAEQQLLAIRTRLKELEQLMIENRGRSFRGADEASFLAAFKQETIRATEAEDVVAKARAALETARSAWLESRRNVRVVENLETKAKLAHLHEVERENQAALDDRTSALAARNAAKKAS